MSPEQARGEPVDKRTDIWAYGCVLFEMCAQHPPFAGATVSDALTVVAEREPAWELLRAETPANIVRVLRRCLTKDPKLRLREMEEVRIALEGTRPAARSRGARFTFVLVILTVAIAVGAWFFVLNRPPSVSTLAVLPFTRTSAAEPSDLADGLHGVLALAWTFPHAQRTQELQVLQDGRLRVMTHTRFTDGSGRQPYDSVDYFSRSAE